MEANYIASVFIARLACGRCQLDFSLDDKTKSNDVAVIALTGPSLLMEDLRCLKKKYYIFGVNALLASPNPSAYIDYCIIQDNQVYKKLSNKIKDFPSSRLILGSSVKYRNGVIKGANYYNLNLRGRYNGKYNPPYKAYWSDKPCIKVYDGYSVAYSAIQILAGIGFRKIIITGFDGGYSENENERNIIDIGKVDHTWAKASERFEYFAGIARENCDRLGVELINISRNTKITNLKVENVAHFL